MPAGRHIRSQANDAFIRQLAREIDNSPRSLPFWLPRSQAPAWQRSEEDAEPNQDRQEKPARHSMSHERNTSGSGCTGGRSVARFRKMGQSHEGNSSCEAIIAPKGVYLKGDYRRQVTEIIQS